MDNGEDRLARPI